MRARTRLTLLVPALLGCDSHFLGGAAAGAGGASAGYEYQNHEALEDLDRDFEEGRISREEYLDRKRDIEKRSILY
jgi:hypothetical protein